jgi:general secretion pathway protein A
MIEFRLKKAGYQGVSKIFLDEAIQEIYAITGGYPRRINMLCHQILKELVVENQKIVDREFVRQLLNRQEGGEQSQMDSLWNQPPLMSGQSMIG